MQDTDAFLTRTIVGAPRSARLGRRIGTPQAAELAPGLRDSSPWIRALEEDPPATAPAEVAAPLPRRGPAGWLKRHALAVVLAGAAAALAGAALALFGTRPWN